MAKLTKKETKLHQQVLESVTNDPFSLWKYPLPNHDVFGIQFYTGDMFWSVALILIE